MKPVHPDFVFAGVRLDADSVMVMVLTAVQKARHAARRKAAS